MTSPAKSCPCSARSATVASCLDVTDRERAIVAEREHARQASVILESVTDSFYALDPDWRFTYVNRQAERYYGRSRDDMLGRSIWQVIPEEVGTVLEEQFRMAAADGIAVHFESESPHTRRWVDVNAYPADGGIAVYFRDVTPRKRAESEREELLLRERHTRADAERARADAEYARQQAERARTDAEAANQAKDDFLATLSHELRSPLQGILGWVAVLKRRSLSPERSAQALDTVERIVHSQSQLINDLIDVSRVVSGKLHIQQAPVDAASLVESTLDETVPAAEAKGVRLERAIHACGEVVGDAERLRQVLANVLTNALKFTPTGGSIVVTCDRDGDDVVVRVQDTGAGIDPGFLPYIFQRFTQAETGSTRRHSGLGLGLAIAHHIVTLHRGTITAESEGSERGATFTIRLPLARPNQAAVGAQPASRGAVSLAGVDVLVVEDDGDSREALRLALENYGARVRVAASVRDAFTAFEQAPPQAIVSDLSMPGEDGYALLRRVRASEGAPKRTPVIALTGLASAEDRARVLWAGFQAHVAKPVDPDELARVIDELTQPALHAVGEES